MIDKGPSCTFRYFNQQMTRIKEWRIRRRRWEYENIPYTHDVGDVTLTLNVIASQQWIKKEQIDNKRGNGYQYFFVISHWQVEAHMINQVVFLVDGIGYT